MTREDLDNLGSAVRCLACAWMVRGIVRQMCAKSCRRRIETELRETVKAAAAEKRTKDNLYRAAGSDKVTGGGLTKTVRMRGTTVRAAVAAGSGVSDWMKTAGVEHPQDVERHREEPSVAEVSKRKAQCDGGDGRLMAQPC